MEHNISYQLCNVQLSRMPGSNFTEGVGGKHPSASAVPGEKSPLRFGLMLLTGVGFYSKTGYDTLFNIWKVARILKTKIS